MQITMCGYRCDLCKAYTLNIEKNDQREKQIKIWDKYFGGFENCRIEDVYCDGCRCDKSNAKRIDAGCPVRECVIKKGIDNCGDCNDFPCGTFNRREGLSREEAEHKFGERFDINEYEEYLKAFDNKTRLNEYIKSKNSK